MHTRPFGTSGTAVSEIGIGCWQIGGSEWGDVPDAEALATLRAAVDSGVTFFDTADVYGLGRSEELIGRFLKETGEKPFVATKLGRFPQPGGHENYTAQTIQAHTEASLKRLGVETLDLTQLHCIPTEELRRGDVFDALRALQRAGKIARFGASVESMEEAFICLEQEGLASLQIIFNIFRQKPIGTLFTAAKERGVSLIVRIPLASGLLSGKMTKETQFAADDHRSFNRNGDAFNIGETFVGLPFETGVDLTDGIRPLVPEGMTMAQMALRWILDYDAVTTVIPGAKHPAMAQANASASDLPPLPTALHGQLRQYYQENVQAHIRGPY